MRTRTDLEGAFALLERGADDYASVHVPTHTAPSELIPKPHVRRRALRGPWAVVGAAAAVAALAVGVSMVAASDPGQNPSGGSTPAHSAARTINVTLDPTLHMSIREVSAEVARTTLEIYSRTLHAELVVRTANDGSRLGSNGLHPVAINGRPGYYSDGSGPALTEPGQAPAAPSSKSSGSAPTRYAAEVVWEYAPHAWASVLFQGGGNGEAGLLRVARAINFGGHHAVRSPIAIGSTPVGMKLTHYHTIYGYPGDNPPFTTAATDWQFLGLFYPDGNGAGVRVDALDARGSKPNTENDLRAGDRIQVGSRQGYWHPKTSELWIDLGDGAFVSVSEAAREWNSHLTMSRDQLVALAKSLAIRLTPKPAQPATWFDLRKAFP